MTSEQASSEHWSPDDIPLDCVDVEHARPWEELYLLVASASFIESGTDLYCRNLVEQFRGDAGISAWLTDRWEPEELQHGRALRAYVNRVWPGVDWAAAYAAFFAEFSEGCTADDLEPTRGLEMAARCVIEMGTATYYRAIRTLSGEPVLERLAGFIEQDEVRHYKHFLGYFRKYNDYERNNRATVLGALSRRLMEIRRSDAECGLWHAYRARHPGTSREGDEFRRAVASTKALVRRHYPAPMAIRMFLRPLALPPALNRLSYHAGRLAQRLILL